MMYKSFPFLSENDRINSNELTHLEFEKTSHPAIVFNKDSVQEIRQLRINTILNKLVYHIETISGKRISRYANNGDVFNLDKTKALLIAKNATGLNSKGKVSILKEVDQWIPRPKYIQHLPVYKVEFENEQHTWVHISSLTGEPLNITTYSDRFWAWVGAIPHWIYFKDIRIHRGLWRQLICWLSGLGLLMTLSGIITGLVRYKKKPKASFKRFKNKWYNLHYYFGLGFGLFVCTWTFSGFMSMTPFNWVPSSSLSIEETNVWQGKQFTLESINNEEWNTFKNIASKSEFREVHFSLFNNRFFTKKIHTNSVENNCITNLKYIPSKEDYVSRINTFNQQEKVTQSLSLKTYDNYYYDRKNKKTLPVTKIITNQNTFFYVHPKTNRILLKSTPEKRTERWIYHGLHSLDFSMLTNNRPLWDIVMIFLLVGGTIVCITATGLGIKFIKRKKKKYLKNG